MMARNKGGEARRNENEHQTSEGVDVGQRSDELNVYNVPEHHLARHQKRVTVVDADDMQAILKRMNYKISCIVFGVCSDNIKGWGNMRYQSHATQCPASPQYLWTLMMIFAP